MRPEDLTKEQVEEMSGAEVKFWCQQFAEQEQVAGLRKHMLDQIRKRDNLVLTPSPCILHTDSKMVE